MPGTWTNYNHILSYQIAKFYISYHWKSKYSKNSFHLFIIALIPDILNQTKKNENMIICNLFFENSIYQNDNYSESRATKSI